MINKPVFISFSSKDHPWAEEISDRLTKAGIYAWLDKKWLNANNDVQSQINRAIIKDAFALIILWSKNAPFSQWIAHERALFQVVHENAPIIYITLDEERPSIDRNKPPLTHLIPYYNNQLPKNVPDQVWIELLQKIKDAIYPDTIEIDCYVLAATKTEFILALKNKSQLVKDLEILKLNGDEVAGWYGENRESWRPLGGDKTIWQIITKLEVDLGKVLGHDYAPDCVHNKTIKTHIKNQGLWSGDFQEQFDEKSRLRGFNFCWVFVDLFSVLHIDNIKDVAHLVESCLESNRFLNVFIYDVLKNAQDRETIRKQLSLKLSNLYDHLMKPGFQRGTEGYGVIDIWHPDDFERVFRETLRQHNQDTLNTKQSEPKNFTQWGPGGMS